MKRVAVIFTLILLCGVVTTDVVAGSDICNKSTARSGDAVGVARTSGGQSVYDLSSRTVGGSLWHFFRRHMVLRFPGFGFAVLDKLSTGNDGPIEVQTPPGADRQVSDRPDGDDNGWEDSN
jgi:hypothetical protein